MKIALFTETYYRGGVANFIINLINNWPADSDKLVLVSNWNNPGVSEFENKIKRPLSLLKHRIPTFLSLYNVCKKKSIFSSFTKILLKCTSFLLRYIFLTCNIFALRRLFLSIKAERLMIVYGGYPNGDSCRAATVAWGMFSKKPKSILNLHGVAIKAPGRLQLQESIIDFFVSRYTENIVTVSHACAKTVSNRPFLKKLKITHIYNGVETTSSLLTKDIREEIGIAPKSQLCVTMSRFDKGKGYDFLLSAFKKVLEEVPDAHLFICGDGPDEQLREVRFLASNLRIKNNVHVTGFRIDNVNILRQADILLVPSQHFESFGLSSIEAMAQGIPVVATDVGALPEVIINNEGGYRVDKNDISAYADCIIRLLKDADLRREQGQRGYRRYREFFTPAQMSRKYSDLIKIDKGL